MSARITSGQRDRIKQIVDDGVIGLNLTKDGAQRVIKQGGVLQEWFKRKVVELAAEFFILLTEDVWAKAPWNFIPLSST